MPNWLKLTSNTRVYSIEYLVFSKKTKVPSTTYHILYTAILASYIAYQVQNFFGFSVVIVALFFFLFPAFAFLAAGAVQPWKVSNRSLVYQIIQSTILRKKGFQTLLIWIIGTITFLTLFTLVKYWRADSLYKNGQDYNDLGNPGRGFNILSDAVSLNPNEPLYRAELGNAAASAAVTLATEDATTSAILFEQAISQTQKAIKISPANTSIWRTAIRTFYDLSIIDPQFEQKTLETFNQTIKLAPTDPKLYYNKALVLESLKKVDEEITTLEKAVQLKPNYLEAIFKLGDAYLGKGDWNKSKQQFEHILKLTPGDPGALAKLQQIATASAKTK